ncbi:unnamed protein product [Allacma fusca]|uniref:Protein sleepless n=1 Tax=Allacma fusca TaxID=39272 RepID=A0A8J2KSD3_9HEXA|nr:unnamed protein product [Allacma fusca]
MVLLKLFCILLVIHHGESIRCYQCTSDDGTDSCGVYGKFDTDRHVPVECQGDEAVTPGTMCIKITQQSPRGFIWDGRWRQVIRRCTSVANTGVTGVCNWGIYENGVYWEECYCSEDSCNSARRIESFHVVTSFISTIILYYGFTLFY